MSLDLTPAESELLFALQRGLPVTERPFAAIAQTLGSTEEEALALLRRLKETGLLRRVGGVFDARRLGYRSSLFAVRVPEAALDAATAAVCPFPGVTHAYARGWPEGYTPPPTLGITAPQPGEYPNLWYTLSEHIDTFDATAKALEAALAPYTPQPFPALRRFKIDVVFDTRTRHRDEQTEYVRQEAAPPAVAEAARTITLTPAQIRLIRHFQNDLPLVPALYTHPAEAAGWSHPDALQQLETWRGSGVLRRMAALLHHRKSGFTANGMCCWAVPEAEIERAGRALANFPEVTHCYERPTLPGFPFTLYAMIHQRDWDAACSVFAHLTEACSLPGGGRIFFSTREFKKTSVQFFPS